MTNTELDTLARRVLLASLHFLVIGVPFIFTWVNEELFEFNKMLLTYGLTAIMVVSWLTRMAAQGKFLWKKTPFDWPLGLFALSQIFSTLFSIHPHTSFFGYYTRFHGGLLSTLTYMALYYAAVNNLTKKDIPKLILSMLAAAGGVALYAIPEHFGTSPSCWLISGGTESGVACWVQDVKSRVFATFGQPNWLAAYFITLLPMMTVMGLTANTLQKKWTSALLIIISMMTLLFTQSRSGVLGLALGLGWLFVLWLVVSIRDRRQPNLGLSTGLVGLALLAPILWWGTPFTPKLTELAGRWPTTVTSETAPSPTPSPVINRLDVGGTDSGEIRKIVWQGAIDVWKRYPIFGSGVETFAYSYYQDRPMAHNHVSEWDFLYNKAHNELLNFLATTGLVGVATYVLLLSWFGLYTLFQTLKPKPATTQTEGWWLNSLVAGVIALSVSNFFGFSTVMVTVLLFLFLALVVITTSDEKAVTFPHHELDSNDWLKVGGLGLLGLWLVWIVTQMWWADYQYAQGKLHLRMGLLNQGIAELQAATQTDPSEGLYQDELASTLAGLAAQLAASQGDQKQIAGLTQAAIEHSNTTLTLNDRHLNFYKTRARIFFTLAQVDGRYLAEAEKTIELAHQLSPTDPKLLYNLALAQSGLNKPDQAIETLKTAIEMKPNYDSARAELGRQLTLKGDLVGAQDQYRYILEKINAGDVLVKQSLEAVEASLSAQVKTK